MRQAPHDHGKWNYSSCVKFAVRLLCKSRLNSLIYFIYVLKPDLILLASFLQVIYNLNPNYGKQPINVIINFPLTQHSFL